MVSSVPPKTPPSPTELLTQLAAARGEVAQAAAASKTVHHLSMAEGLFQAARLARDSGNEAQAQALIDEAGRLDVPGIDLKV